MPQDENWPDGLIEWVASGETGASAKAIVAHLMGRGEQTGCYPLDGGDFGRCERMLDMIPSLRPELHRMAEVNAYWSALVERWDEIRNSPDQSKMIKKIIRPIEDADPGHVRLSDTTSVRLLNPAPSAQAKVKPMMKPDPEFDAARHNAYRVTADELRQFIERYERLDQEKKEIADEQKEVMAEAKARGSATPSRTSPRRPVCEVRS